MYANVGRQVIVICIYLVIKKEPNNGTSKVSVFRLGFESFSTLALNLHIVS